MVKIKIGIVIDISIVTIQPKQERTWRNYWTGLCGQTLQRVVSKFKDSIYKYFARGIVQTNIKLTFKIKLAKCIVQMLRLKFNYQNTQEEEEELGIPVIGF